MTNALPVITGTKTVEEEKATPLPRQGGKRDMASKLVPQECFFNEMAAAMVLPPVEVSPKAESSNNAENGAGSAKDHSNSSSGVAKPATMMAGAIFKTGVAPVVNAQPGKQAVVAQPAVPTTTGVNAQPVKQAVVAQSAASATMAMPVRAAKGEQILSQTVAARPVSVAATMSAVAMPVAAGVNVQPGKQAAVVQSAASATMAMPVASGVKAQPGKQAVVAQSAASATMAMPVRAAKGEQVLPQTFATRPVVAAETMPAVAMPAAAAGNAQPVKQAVVAQPAASTTMAVPARAAKGEQVLMQTVAARPVAVAAPAPEMAMAMAGTIPMNAQPRKTTLEGQTIQASKIALPTSELKAETVLPRKTLEQPAADAEPTLGKADVAQIVKMRQVDVATTIRQATYDASLDHARLDTKFAAKHDHGMALPKAALRRAEANTTANHLREPDKAVVPKATGLAAGSRPIFTKEAEVRPTEATMSAQAKDAQPLMQDQAVRGRMDVAAADASRQTATAITRFEEMAQRVERLQQVVEKFEQNISMLGQKNGGSLTIELTPASLGKVVLDCDVKDGSMTLKLVTDSDGARNVLVDHTQAIRDVVQNAGYALAHLDVRTRSEWTDQRQAAARQQSGGARRERKSDRETNAAAAVAGTTPGARYDDGHAHAVWLVA